MRQNYEIFQKISNISIDALKIILSIEIVEPWKLLIQQESDILNYVKEFLKILNLQVLKVQLLKKVLKALHSSYNKHIYN